MSNLYILGIFACLCFQFGRSVSAYFPFTAVRRWIVIRVLFYYYFSLLLRLWCYVFIYQINKESDIIGFSVRIFN